MKKPILIITAALIVIIVGAFVWLYTGSLSGTKVNVFKKTNLPIAIVDNRFVGGREFLDRLELAKSLSQNNPEFQESEVKDQILSQLIDTQKLIATAKDSKVSVTQEAIDMEYQAFVDNFAQGDAEKFKTVLGETYKLTPDDFKQKILQPDLLLSNLTVWHNQQENLNQDAYNKEKEITSKLNEGKTFEDVAKESSEDESTKEFGGDAGFVTVKELLPEFQQALKDTKQGDQKLIVSRFGLHIVKVAEVDTSSSELRYHLQQIYVKTDNFPKWYEEQTNKLKVYKLLKV